MSGKDSTLSLIGTICGLIGTAVGSAAALVGFSRVKSATVAPVEETQLQSIAATVPEDHQGIANSINNAVN